MPDMAQLLTLIPMKSIQGLSKTVSIKAFSQKS